MSWQRDKSRADELWPQIEQIIRSVAGQIIDVQPASEEDDQQRATDYVIQVNAGSIGCRVRFNTSFRDITIRSHRPSGVRTELDKLGDLRWYLYCWAEGHGPCHIVRWDFFDVQQMLAAGLLDQASELTNIDGTRFRAFPAALLAGNGLVASGEAA